MAKLDVLNLSGAVTGSIELSDDIFGIAPNQSAIAAVIRNQLANRRQGTQSTKTRSEVSGGGKRPWRQKGTGRARHGSTRSAQYVGGGIIFGPKPRSYSYTLPKKLRRLALKSVLSSKLADKKIIVVDDVNFESIKTAAAVKMLSPCPLYKSSPRQKCRDGILPNAGKPLEFSRKGLLYYNSSSYSF